MKVTREGREGIYLVGKVELVEFLEQSQQEQIHCYLGRPPMLIGADWEKASVIEEVRNSERLAILMGSARRNNFGHALALVKNNQLEMFDLEIKEEELEVE